MRRDLRAPVDRPRQRLLTDIREGIDYIVGQPVLRAAILFWGATSIINAPLVTALAVHITRDLGDTASALGHRPGGVRDRDRDRGAGHLAPRRPPARLADALRRERALRRLAAARLGRRVDPGRRASSRSLAGIAQSMVLVTYITLRAAYSPDELLGRIGSTARTISLGLQPIGLLVGGALIDLTSGSTTIALMGIAILLRLPGLRAGRRAPARDAAARAPLTATGQAASASGAATSGAMASCTSHASQATSAGGRVDGHRAVAPGAIGGEHRVGLHGGFDGRTFHRACDTYPVTTLRDTGNSPRRGRRRARRSA